MKLGLIRNRWGAAGVAFVTASALAGGAASAAGPITTSHVQKPADGTLLFQNLDTHKNQNFKVSGTSNGGSGDAVDIACYENGKDSRSYKGPGGTGIPVGSTGSFSVSVPQSTFAGLSCELLAVPHGTAPNPPTGYTGPRVGFSYFQTNRISSGANSGDAYDYTFTEATPKTNEYVDSIASCGPGVYPIDGTPTMNTGPYLLNCGGTLFGAPKDFFATNNLDLQRSEIQVDGHNAYGSSSANNLNNGIAGFPKLAVKLDSFNASTGNAKTTESERLVKCTPNDIWNPSPSDCTAYAGTGVAVKRVTTFSKAGRVQTVTDTFTSTDHKAHSLSLLYEMDLNNPTGGWQLPGQSSFQHHNTGDTGSAPKSAPGTVYVIDDTSKAPSLANPVGALTFAFPYQSVRFDNTLWSTYGAGEESALFRYTRKVPAGGSTTITWSYATGTSLAQVHRYAAAARKTL